MFNPSRSSTTCRISGATEVLSGQNQICLLAINSFPRCVRPRNEMRRLPMSEIPTF